MVNAYKKLRAFISILKVVKNPYDTENIGKLTELGNDPQKVQGMFAHLKSDPHCRRVLKEQIPVKPFTLEQLSQYKPGTFGHEYYLFLTKNNLNIDLIPVKPDSPLNYIRYRYRKYHDMWHVLLGYNTSLEHEFALQVFTYAQLKSLMSVLIVALGLIHIILFKSEIMDATFDVVTDAWVRGKNAPMIWGIALEDYFDEDLEIVKEKILRQSKNQVKHSVASLHGTL